MHVLFALLLASLLGTAVAQPAATATAAPPTTPPFSNNYPHPGQANFLAWQWERLRDGLPRPPPPSGWAIPAQMIDPASLRPRASGSR